MKVTLVLCPRWDPCCPVASFGLLSSQLKMRGHDVEIADLNRVMTMLDVASGYKSWGHLGTGDAGTSPEFVRSLFFNYRGWLESYARKLVSNGCRLFGFSSYYSNHLASLEFAKILKKTAPDIKIVFGGPNCLRFSFCLSCVREDCVDGVVFGEGDISFPGLVDGFEATGRLQAGPGILLKDDETTWKNEQEIVDDLNRLPYADYSGFAMLDTYEAKMIHTARGCIRKCVFCSDWRQMSFRRMGGRRIFDEVAHQLSSHPKMNRFIFGDSILNSSMPDLLEFCDLVLGRGLKISWEGYAIVRPDMPPRAMEAMRRSGCRGLYYGVETGSSRLLRDMGKGVPAALNAEILRRTTEAGISSVVTWMVGFPTETEEFFEESLDFLRANAKNIGMLGMSLFSIQEMQDISERFNFAPGQHDLFWNTKDGKNTFPVRLKRMRRTFEAAAEAGIYAGCWGISSLSEWERCEQELMGRYESWLAAAPH
ncbi:MAG TPA: radical SAM protein [Elusimicrobiota bacterium]|nr:radical SAM protein [Elusimicrobiota bacterium]